MMTKPLPIPKFLKQRPRSNSYPSPKDMEFINRIKKPKLKLLPKKKSRSKSFPELEKREKTLKKRKSF